MYSEAWIASWKGVTVTENLEERVWAMKGELGDYKTRIGKLVDQFPLEIDKDIIIAGRPPTSANSEFLTNKEQGDWAEKLVLKAINDSSSGFVALPYGRSDSITAGDKGFPEFYKAYQDELNTIGKKPDILLFRYDNAPLSAGELDNREVVSHAVAAIEVRSSSFLCGKYKSAMSTRIATAERRCAELRDIIMEEPYGSLLKDKNPVVYGLLKTATVDTFRNLTFRAVSWQSSADLRSLSTMMKELKTNIATLHKRDYLSITPKSEDIALVNRWISNFHVPHFYLQVFFDRAYIISFEKILTICSDPQREDKDFTFEKDVKNQGKRTVKVNIDIGEPIIGKIDMPPHFSAMKELDRGRLLFYVKVEGGQGYLDLDVFRKVLTR